MEEPQRAIVPEQLAAASFELPSSNPTTATTSSSNLRDFLTVRQEEPLHQRLGRRGTSVSLGTVLACEKRDLPSPGLVAATSHPTATTTGGRTLLDIIRDEEESCGGTVYEGFVIGGSNGGHKISWRAFKDRLRVRRAGTPWQPADGGGNRLDDVSATDFVLPSPAAVSTSGTPALGGRDLRAAAVPEHSPASAVSNAGEPAGWPTPAATIGSPVGAPSFGEQAEGSNRGAVGPATGAASGEAQQQQQQEEPQPIRVSLMALLEQTDRQGDGPGFPISALLGPEEEEAEEEEGEEEEGGRGEAVKMYVKCCVCMVRHKGAAFIPCGHTFCRRCSRELWVSRGNCPLCNGFILEILDIF